jgi:hypothetical protein
MPEYVTYVDKFKNNTLVELKAGLAFHTILKPDITANVRAIVIKSVHNREYSPYEYDAYDASYNVIASNRRVGKDSIQDWLYNKNFSDIAHEYEFKKRFPRALSLKNLER